MKYYTKNPTLVKITKGGKMENRAEAGLILCKFDAIENAIFLHRRPPVEKPVENVENSEFSTCIVPSPQVRADGRF